MPAAVSRSKISEQAAFLGLIKAINRYDPALSDRFLAYATPTMVGEVRRHFRDTTWRIRVPRVLQERRIALRHVARDFAHEHGRAPTVAEIARLLELTEENVIEVMAASGAYQPLSLDTPINDDDEPATVADQLGDDDDELESIVDKLALRPLLDGLPDRERGILLLRFYGNKTQTEISDQLGISQMHVSRLIRKCLDELRVSLLNES